MSEGTRETTRLPRAADVVSYKYATARRAVEPRRAKGMWVPTWLFWLWWVLVLLPSALLVYESVVGW